MVIILLLINVINFFYVTFVFLPPTTTTHTHTRHSLFKHQLHVLDLLSGELFELGVDVEDLGGAREGFPLVDRLSPQQFCVQLRICVSRARFLFCPVMRARAVHSNRIHGTFFDLQAMAKLRRELV